MRSHNLSICTRIHATNCVPRWSMGPASTTMAECCRFALLTSTTVFQKPCSSHRISRPTHSLSARTSVSISPSSPRGTSAGTEGCSPDNRSSCTTNEWALRVCVACQRVRIMRRIPRGPKISTSGGRRLGGGGAAWCSLGDGAAPRTLRRKVRMPIVWSAASKCNVVSLTERETRMLVPCI